ncbi:unnamed protein product, partial [Prorocentrum cordatum]
RGGAPRRSRKRLLSESSVMVRAALELPVPAEPGAPLAGAGLVDGVAGGSAQAPPAAWAGSAAEPRGESGVPAPALPAGTAADTVPVTCAAAMDVATPTQPESHVTATQQESADAAAAGKARDSPLARATSELEVGAPPTQLESDEGGVELAVEALPTGVPLGAEATEASAAPASPSLSRASRFLASPSPRASGGGVGLAQPSVGGELQDGTAPASSPRAGPGKPPAGEGVGAAGVAGCSVQVPPAAWAGGAAEPRGESGGCAPELLAWTAASTAGKRGGVPLRSHKRFLSESWALGRTALKLPIPAEPGALLAGAGLVDGVAGGSAQAPPAAWAGSAAEPRGESGVPALPAGTAADTVPVTCAAAMDVATPTQPESHVTATQQESADAAAAGKARDSPLARATSELEVGAPPTQLESDEGGVELAVEALPTGVPLGAEATEASAAPASPADVLLERAGPAPPAVRLGDLWRSSRRQSFRQRRCAGASRRFGAA